MHLIIENKKLDIVQLDGFWEKFKGLKFYLEKLDCAVKFTNKKFVSTAFLCQRIDIIAVDKDNYVVAIYKNVKSEKYFFTKFKTKDIYYLPLGLANNYSVGDQLIFKKATKS